MKKPDRSNADNQHKGIKVAIIPARGGSKRIPKKNIKAFAGKPIIAFSIEAAKAAQLFDRIIVSTDSEDIAEVAKQYGAEVLERPATLADDYTGTNAVVAQVLEQLSSTTPIELACCIYATAPFITSDDLLRGHSAITEGECQFAFSVCDYAFPIFRAIKLQQPDNSVEMFFPEHLMTRSQDLEVAYHDAGQFYWGKPEAFINEVRLFGPESIGVPIPRIRVQDIDTPEDWENAELMYEVLERKKHDESAD